MRVVNQTVEGLTTPCVLIVDDDPLVLHALETAVLSAGYLAVATIDPLLGLKCLQGQPVSVIIADQRMDAMSGLELLGHARSLQPQAARILITGLLSVKMLTEAVNCGEIYRFIAKPWSTPELISTVHTAVQRYHLLCENAALQAGTQKLNAELLAEKCALEAQVAKLELARDRVWATREEAYAFCDAVLSSFDGNLAVRTRRTVEICRRLAEAAALPTDLRDDLISIAWFHDLGFIALSRDPNPEGTHDTGHAMPRDHPAISERLALAAGLSDAVAAAVRAHHESFDGGGFPDRLRGREIPEITRWFTPVAYFVACGLDRQRAIEEIERLAGVAFDPYVVPFLLRIALQLPSPDASASGASPFPTRHGAISRRALATMG